jgi:hypothetical protein
VELAILPGTLKTLKIMKTITAYQTRCPETSGASMCDSASSHDFIFINDDYAIDEEGTIWQVIPQYEDCCILTYESEDGNIFNYAEDGKFNIGFFDYPDWFDNMPVSMDEWEDFANEIDEEHIYELLELVENWNDFYQRLWSAYCQRESSSKIKWLEENDVNIHEQESADDCWEITYNGNEPDAWDDAEITEYNFKRDDDLYNHIGECFKILVSELGRNEAAAFCGYKYGYKHEYLHCCNGEECDYYYWN